MHDEAGGAKLISRCRQETTAMQEANEKQVLIADRQLKFEISVRT